jgi:hypothetical protein
MRGFLVALLVLALTGCEVDQRVYVRLGPARRCICGCAMGACRCLR